MKPKMMKKKYCKCEEDFKLISATFGGRWNQLEKIETKDAKKHKSVQYDDIVISTPRDEVKHTHINTILYTVFVHVQVWIECWEWYYT